jgi:molybdopterin synthase catalytic subunit
MHCVGVQTDPIDLAAAQEALWRGHSGVGAVVTFIGLVRDFNADAAVMQLTLEQYPGMTQRVLESLVATAAARWECQQVTLIHRVGTLFVQDPIVLIGVTSAHRGDAFRACEFLIDELKTHAPLWKKESTATGARWVTPATHHSAEHSLDAQTLVTI